MPAPARPACLMEQVTNIVIKRWGGRAVLLDQALALAQERGRALALALATVQAGEVGNQPTFKGALKMKSSNILSLVLIATSLASGAAYAKGGSGGGMGSGGFGSADHVQRTEIRSQDRVQERTQKRDGSQAGNAQRNEYRHENRHEDRAQMRIENTLPSMH